MKDIIVIGFGHKARSGKDTAVQTIIDARGSKYDIRRMAFADELKREVADLNQFEWCLKYGIPYDNNPPMNDPLCPPPHGKQARFLQWYGTEYRRAQNPFYWVKKLEQRVKQETPHIVLIPDVRFKNEFFWVRSMGGFNVKVNRLGYVDPSRDPNHISETDLQHVMFDVEIARTDGELEGVKEDAVRAFDTILSWLRIDDVDTDYSVSGMEKDADVIFGQTL